MIYESAEIAVDPTESEDSEGGLPEGLPFRALWCAILESAFRDARNGPTKGPHFLVEYAEAPKDGRAKYNQAGLMKANAFRIRLLDWAQSPRFIQVCQVADVDIDTTRRELVTLVEGTYCRYLNGLEQRFTKALKLARSKKKAPEKNKQRVETS